MQFSAEPVCGRPGCWVLNDAQGGSSGGDLLGSYPMPSDEGGGSAVSR